MCTTERLMKHGAVEWQLDLPSVLQHLFCRQMRKRNDHEQTQRHNYKYKYSMEQLDIPSVLQHHQTFAISLWWDFSTESKEYNVAPSCKIPLVFSETAAGSSGCDWRSRRTKKTKTIKQIKRKREQQKETKNDRAKKQKQQKDKFPSWHTRMATVDKMDNVCFTWQILISCFLWHATIVYC